MSGLTTILNSEKRRILEQLAYATSHVPGDMAELGVYMGGTSLMLAQALPDKKLHLLDTFEGMPVKDEIDYHKVGEFKDGVDFPLIVETFSKLNAEIHKGFFPDTAQGMEHLKFSLVHIDADQYQVTKDALEWFYPRMAKGGVIVLDDYKWHHCPGVEKALHEFMVGKSERVLSDTPHQAYFFV